MARQAGSIPSNELARRFCDFLATHNVEAFVAAEPDGSLAIWVNDDDHLAAVRTHLAAFLSDPNAERYRVSQGAAKAQAEVRAASVEAFQRRQEQLRQRWRQGGQQTLTLILIAVSVTVSLATRLGDDPGMIR